MTPNYPQLTTKELEIIIFAAIRQFAQEEKDMPLDNTEWIKLCYKIYNECQNTGAIFFDIVPDYATEKEGD